MNFDSHRSLVFGSQIVAIVVVLASLVGQRAELRSQRPSARQEGSFLDEPLRLRLWDDPFRVLRDQDTSEAESGPGAVRIGEEGEKEEEMQAETKIPIRQELADQSVGADSDTNARERRTREAIGVWGSQQPDLAKRLQDARRGTLILMVVLDRRSTPEAEELRLRSRYAIISALLTAGYRTVSDSGVWPFRAAEGSQQGDSMTLPLTGNMVWERFSEEEIRIPYLVLPQAQQAHAEARAKYPDVYVCWVRDKIPSEHLIAEPVANAVMDAIFKGSTRPEEKRIVVFDLGNSDRLRGFLWGSRDGSPANGRGIAADSKVAGPDVYFLRATASEWLLNTAALWDPPRQRPVRLAQQDDVLIDVLFRELKMRLPILQHRADDPAGKLGQIVLFTESDTTYSQAITQEVQTFLWKESPGSKAADLLEGRWADGWRLRIFTYLRGLDGRRDIERAPTTAKIDPVADPINALLNQRVLTEESSGTSQFDYLRRQALQLKLDHQTEPVVAVGVLGSDVYDKLVVLQALRPELPQAVFFTTDLDALYLHADNAEVTRNLLVASASNLEPDIAGSGQTVPPMRDSYQTILFEATRSLVRGEKLVDVRERSSDQVQLFEIGAGRAVPLERFEGKGQSSPEEEKDTAQNSYARMKYLALPWLNFLVFALAIGNGLLVLWAVCSRKAASSELHGPAPLPGWSNRLLAIESVLAGLAITVLAGLFISNRFWGSFEIVLMEPLSWTLGLSVWPTILIRCVAFFVALRLMIKASEYVDVKYRFTRDRLRDLLGADARLNLNLLFQETPLDFFERRFLRLGPKSGEPQTVTEFLESIHDRSRRVWRVAVLAILYVAFSIFLFAVFPTYTPGRGFAVLLVEKVVLAFGVGLYIVHLLYCLDLHLGARTLLCALREHLAMHKEIDEYKVLEAAGEYTIAVGRTLLYPLTVFIILMLSRIRLFDAWSMTPSLWIVMGFGAILISGASMLIVSEARRMRNDALHRANDKKHALEMNRQKPDKTPTPPTDDHSQGLTAALDGADAKKNSLETKRPGPATPSTPTVANVSQEIAGLKQRMQELRDLDVGAFAPWFRQPIFAALVSLLGVVGTVGFAEPLVDLLIR